MQHLITYAKDKTTGETRNIKDVESGLACNCVCGNCGGALEACKGKIRQHHFRHYSAAECKGAWESQLHLLSKAIIANRKMIAIPAWTGQYLTHKAKQQTFESVELEIAQDDLQPDCLCTYIDDVGNKQTLWIEILNTHAVDEEKAKKIKERGIACVEIDVSQLFQEAEVIDEETLKDFLLNKTENRQWINNPIGEKDEQFYISEARKLNQQSNVIRFIEEHSLDAKLVNKLTFICFYFYVQGFKLNTQTHNFLYDYITFYRGRIHERGEIEQRFFVSAMQFLTCNQVQLNRYRLRNYTKESIFCGICMDRKGLLKDLGRSIDEAIRPGKMR